jgi:diguanylate cyclase (GGDEF)-like protein
MKIRGKLISGFGGVTLAILVVYAILIYISFAENISKDRTEAYNSKVKAVVLTTEMQIRRQIDALRREEAAGRASAVNAAPLFSGLRRIVFANANPLSFAALAKETGMRLPAGWQTAELARRLDDSPQLLLEDERMILLLFESRGEEQVCYLFEVARPQLLSLLQKEMLLEKSKMFLSRDGQFILELADRTVPEEQFLTAEGFEALEGREGFSRQEQGKFVPLSETMYLFSAKSDFFGLHLDYLLPRTIFLQDLLRLKNRVIAATIILAWIAVWVILILAYGFSRPIVKLAKMTNDMIAFNYQTPFEFSPSGDEIGALARSFETMRQKIEQLVTRDPLTKTYTRGFLMHMFKVTFARAQRYDERLACIILDIDHFKKINDTYGHQAGDDVLQAVGKLLLDGTRSSDLVSTVARYGGEEFVVLLPSLTAEGAYQVAERLRQAISSHQLPHGIRCTISLGVAVRREDHDNPDKLIGEADQALYRAKKHGRNQTVVFEPIPANRNAAGGEGDANGKSTN